MEMALPHFLHLPFLPINASETVYAVEQDGQIIFIGMTGSVLGCPQLRKHIWSLHLYVRQLMQRSLRHVLPYPLLHFFKTAILVSRIAHVTNHNKGFIMQR